MATLEAGCVLAVSELTATGGMRDAREDRTEKGLTKIEKIQPLVWRPLKTLGEPRSSV